MKVDKVRGIWGTFVTVSTMKIKFKKKKMCRPADKRSRVRL